MTYPKGSATVGEHFSLHYSNSYPTCRQWDIQDNYTAQHIYIYTWGGWKGVNGAACLAMPWSVRTWMPFVTDKHAESGTFQNQLKFLDKGWDHGLTWWHQREATCLAKFQWGARTFRVTGLEIPGFSVKKCSWRGHNMSQPTWNNWITGSRSLTEG